MISNIILNYLPILGTILIVLSYLGQLKTTYGTKNVEGQSLFFWIVLDSALFINTIREIYLYKTQGTFGGVLTQGFNLVLGASILVGVIMYRKKDK